ncbi:hypothetical protein [Streptomyces sp. NPDC054783]
MLNEAVTPPGYADAPSPHEGRVERARLALQQLGIDYGPLNWDAMENALIASKRRLVGLGRQALRIFILGILEHIAFAVYTTERPNSIPFLWFQWLTGTPERFTPGQINETWAQMLNHGLGAAGAWATANLGWRAMTAVFLMWLFHELLVGALLWLILLGLTDRRSIWRPALLNTPVGPAVDLVTSCRDAFRSPLGARNQKIAAVEDATERLARSLNAAARHGGGMTNRRAQRTAMRTHACKVIAALYATENELYTGPDEALRRLAQHGIRIADNHAAGRICALLPDEELTGTDGDRLEGQQWAITVSVGLGLSFMVCVPAMWLLRVQEQYALATTVLIITAVAFWRHGTRGSERLLARLHRGSSSPSGPNAL